MKFRVIIEPQPEGGYVAYVPALPGCVSQGETKEEVLRNIKEAIELYLEVVEEQKLKDTMREIKRRDNVQIAEVSV
ncbi:type II toxin-antitoxin system HicB family antitoxin [Thermococcus sp. Bubb.Bath]|uniref:type II toxin-antitoxin system HicB family antitoxin n=1 Tax=Thermococcus sp. Bubb.Bath TaxID=1638242 RepID=UPI00143947A8|nr:type II toxin-antitoxin system HicB family antitoxin [Thermococcus sp. Bubb.Bath]NJF24288.1 type II toxin-antitoxin system HicB family antitoxin [Thermococcus sp. Bubb.Bath]